MTATDNDYQVRNPRDSRSGHRLHRMIPSNDNRIDEGFSEEVDEAMATDTPVTPEPIEVDQSDDLISHAASVRDWLLAQPAELRSEFARLILASLPTSSLALIVRETDSRLHHDPALYFPPEIVLQIFNYLTPNDLVTASYISKAWRLRALEPTLWRRLFSLEGWTHNRATLRSLEDSSATQIRKLWLHPRVRAAFATSSKGLHDPSTSMQMSKKDWRIWVSNATVVLPTEWTGDLGKRAASQADVHSCFMSSSETRSGDDTDMLDISRDSFQVHSNMPLSTGNIGIPATAICPLLQPQRLAETMNRLPQPNWYYLFNQRRRLEHNWKAGLYKNFRLPREGFEKERHRECIYTLQFSSKYVVSGSRDKTIRIWDLESQRLAREPLIGHRASVLCLQFDESPDQDIIVSGGSDADVIVWKFSTGEKIKHLRRAHTQAVLNLRFDDRYLVTCSKDNSIKVWNRKAMSPLDPAYPVTNRSRDATFPDYIVNLAELPNDPAAFIPPTFEAYQELMCLNGHTAAVNALSLHGNRVASASGDRKIMLWDIPTGALIKIFSGHTKGIACVQYDGRRIISGSSDETVLVFDAETGAQVSSLIGHKDLVRTVQSEFGDIPGDDEKYAASAQAHTDMLVENKRKRLFGEIAPPQDEEQFVLGAKLPPGGGGNRWAKIVSGSYDEMVIVWRQDKTGRWMINQKLQQEDALRATGIEREAPAPQVSAEGEHDLPSMQTLQQAPVTTGNATRLSPETVSQLQRDIQRQRNLQTAHAWMSIPPGATSSRPRTTPHANLTPQSQGVDRAARTTSESLPSGTPTVASSSRPPLQTPNIPLLQARQAQQRRLSHSERVVQHAQASNTQNQRSNGLHPLQSTSASQNPNQPPQQQTVPGVTPATQANPNGHHNHPQNHHNHRHAHNEQGDNNTSRLFKVQFDSRRIICCSQQPIIVGWDFANGDEDIIEASQFFGETG